MNLKELSQIDVKDLKNVNWKEVLEFFKKRWDVSAQIIAVIISIVACFWVHSMNKERLSLLNIDVQTAQEKLAKLNELHEVESFNQKILDALPPEISEKRLINLMADLAKEYNVRIHSFSPNDPIKKDSFTIFPLTLNLSSQNYKAMWTFIEKLETLPEAITIQGFNLGSSGISGRPRQPNRRTTGAGPGAVEPGDDFSITITVHGVNFIKHE